MRHFVISAAISSHEACAMSNELAFAFEHLVATLDTAAATATDVLCMRDALDNGFMMKLAMADTCFTNGSSCLDATWAKASSNAAWLSLASEYSCTHFAGSALNIVWKA